MESGNGAGGSVNACNPSSGACSQVATGLPIVTAAAVDRGGDIHVVINALLPTADVIALP
jgi:hypothetical protein